MFKSYLWKRRFKKYKISIREVRKATLERLSDIQFEIKWIVLNQNCGWFSSTGWAYSSWKICQLRRMTGARWFDSLIFESAEDQKVIMLKSKEFEFKKGGMGK